MEDAATKLTKSILAQMISVELGILDNSHDDDDDISHDNQRRLELIEKVLEEEGGIKDAGLLAGLLFAAMPRIDPTEPLTEQAKNAFADVVRQQLKILK